MKRTLGLERFEDEMVIHLHRFAPRHAAVIGDEWVRRTIRLGVERARAYGVTNPGLLRFYVELMFMFGSMFDTDPLQPWAGAILKDPSIPDEASRVDRLYDAMLSYLDNVDPERTLSLQALRNLRHLLREDPPVAALRVEEVALDTMARVYPQRCAYLGEPLLRRLIRRGAETAGRYDLGTDRGVVLITGMMFGIGHGCAEDPLFPWVQATLHDTAIKSAERRVARLHKRVAIYLERALEYLEGRRANGLLQ
ncbi:hypothetical protein [Sorangium sp. So ce131]|uniref:hypothetical protein n=1 Tax=Sorangium sp. So ce131 TaxID=3133282 RepID=UPI003F633244